MNAVGKIGKMIVEYQYEIEIALLAFLALIVAIWIVRLIVRAVKRRDVLTEINSKVEDINATVNDINRRQEVLISEASPEKREETEGGEEIGNSAVAVTAKAPPADRPLSEAIAAEAPPKFDKERPYEPALRYYSRECAMDKFGNVYSEEVLNEQIH